MIVKILRALGPVVLFVTTFLLGFLLIGCVDDTAVVSSVNLISLTLSDSLVSVTAGYLAVCIDDGSTYCANTNNLTALELYSEAANLVTVASLFSDTCHPRLLLTVIGLTIAMLLLSIWQVVPLLPWKTWVLRGAAALGALDVLLWGLGAMLQHEATSGLVTLAPVISDEVIDASSGTRAEVMTWLAFAFLVVVEGTLIVDIVTDIKRAAIADAPAK